jgi:hypothetical protein
MCSAVRLCNLCTGAITAVYAALLPANITSPRGEFLADKQVQSLTATFPYN